MKTEDIKDLIFSYLSGELTEEDTNKLSVWLNASEENKKTYSELTDWWAIAHVPQFESLAVSDFENLKAKLQKEDRMAPVKINRYAFSWRNMAATLLLVLASGVASYIAGDSGYFRQVEIASFETVVPLGSRSKVILPDQSVVWVNAGSSLRYNEEFSEKMREVYLKGEAYFEVMPDSLRPFIVKSDQMDVKVLGTTFNVSAYEEDEFVDVVLLTGKVDVLLSGPVSGRSVYRLLPDEMLRYDKSTETLKKTKVDAANFCAWINGDLKFTKVPFSQLVHELERKYNIRLICKSRFLPDEIFSGSFTSSQTIYSILDEINVEKKYEWTQEGNVFTLSDR